MEPDREPLAQSFRAWSLDARDCDCPLYERLATAVADDPELLRIAATVGRPPETNVFFAAVHFLLLGATEPARGAPLARWYRSLVDDPLPAASAFPAFRAFVLDRQAELAPLLRTRITQTNEVRRAGYLLPAFTAIHRAHGRRPLALLDIGCSAGLHLRFDRYAYDYGGVRAGDPGAAVVLRIDARGERPLPLDPRFPPCPWRRGIDLHPLDLADPIERRWFEALIWPDHVERRALARRAIAELLADPPPIVRGDAIEQLDAQLADVPAELELIVYHCHALCQASAAELARFGERLLAASHRRRLHWLACEADEVVLRTLEAGDSRERKLARKDGHGRWIEWLADVEPSTTAP
ncbi:MAG: DUF2332 domain-containing protein [Planctomycetes bacterium]|nr:DUF2332 domain-containing protein [Planctomycetota bacterium]